MGARAGIIQSRGQVVEASAPARNVAINDYAYALASAGKQPPEIAAAVVEWDADRHEDHADGPWFSDKKEPHRGHPGKAARVADDIAKRAVTKATRRGDALPAESLQVPKPSSSEVTAGGAQSGGASYGQLADDFLKDCGLTHGKTSLLKKYQGDYYVFDTDHYVMIDEEDVKARIVRYLRKRSDTKHTVKTSTLPNVMTNLMDATHVDTHVQLPSRNGKAFNKIPFRNGWVSLEDALEGRKVEPEPHSPEIFSLWCLPFDYSPLTSCPTWDRVLKTSLRNDAMMDCLEEWVGLHFLPPALRMGEQMFALFVGDGANGKSVISCVMRTLFGESNVSAVPLESFRAEGFMMIHMFGKVANIVDEVSDHDASNEEILKKYTAGGVIQANRKNQKAIDFKPSAPLTFSCNTPPRFRDTSGAVKRRLLPFPFNHVIPKKEQDKRLTTAEFWINSGELPGIFARCMTALKRQQERGFTPSPVMQAMIEVLDDINNPTHVWLRDHFEMGEADYPVLVYALHARYLASDVGKKSQTMFNMDVKKVFPGADQTKNANKMYHVIGRDPVRSRVWVGLRERK
jgi:P4 family phage/plasmid primase-like protien